MAAISSNNSFDDGADGNDSTSLSDMELFLPPAARFWLILIFEIPSLACSLFLIYSVLIDRTLRQALHNHIILALLITGLPAQLIDIPNTLAFLRLDQVWPQIPVLCYAWWFVGTACYNTVAIFMAWASIERHILVFHQHWLSTQKKRFFIHYVPMASIALYSLVFYTVSIFFSQCQPTFDYTQFWCGPPCYFEQTNLVIYDIYANIILPIFLIIIFNIFLVIRVVKQKHRLHQQMQWHKYRRMVLQLVSCAIHFLIFYLPNPCLNLAHMYGLPFGAAGQYELFMYYISCFVIILMPFVCLGSSPEIWKTIKNMWNFKRRVVNVVPATNPVRPMTMKNTVV